MKLAIIVAVCMAAVAVRSDHVHKDVKVADKAFLTKQMFFSKILADIGHPLMIEDLIKHGEKLHADKALYIKYDDSMLKFRESYKVGSLLAHDDFFSIVNEHHMHQALGLFHFFYYAKDWATFADNVVWARMNVNPGMFVHALTMAVNYRDDLKEIILPAIYEIFPQMFFNSKFIMETEKFDWELWNKHIMYEKQWSTIYEKKHVKNIHDKYWYMKDWKMWQWWKLMGLDEEWHLEEKCILRENTEILKNDSKWMALWNDMKMMWMPVDYTRDIDILNDESKLTYLTEDLGWNKYWYDVNMCYAMRVNGTEIHSNKDRHGEMWFYILMQLLARYHMERLSHGMGEIPTLSWHGIVNKGYNPMLISYNGLPFTHRPNYWEVQSFENVNLLNKLINIEHRLEEVIAWGEFKTTDDVKIDLRKSDAIEHIGNMLLGNMDSSEKTFFGNYYTMCSNYFTGHMDDVMPTMPSTFSNYETEMRDPLFYQCLKKMEKIWYDFKDMLPSYTQKELMLEGVAIADVKVDKMMTYFDLVDFDVSNLMNDHMTIEHEKNIWEKTLLARQMRLNHKPYNVEMMVTSDKAQKVVVLTFLVPSYDEFGQKINPIKHSEHVMELDKFAYDLVAGENIIKRSSKDYMWTIADRTTYSELHKLMTMAYDGKAEFKMDISEPHCGFPQRLVLPRGWVKGMPMKMFFMITPYEMEHEHDHDHDHDHEHKHEHEHEHDHTYLCGMGSADPHINSHPFGYPFDRKIESISEFFMPNMFWKDVKIYHMDKFEKYREHKYEHFGSFDYDMN